MTEHLSKDIFLSLNCRVPLLNSRAFEYFTIKKMKIKCQHLTLGDGGDRFVTPKKRVTPLQYARF